MRSTMRIFNASLLIALMLLWEATAFDLKCFADITPNSTCIVYDLVVTKQNETITSVNGHTMAQTAYTALLIQNQTVNFVPKNIAGFFPALTELEISNSSLKLIEQGNIGELTSLTTLNLAINNLTVLEKDLFTRNIALQRVNISHNQLQFVHQDVFALTQLKAVHLEHNTCTESFWSGYQSYFINFNNYNYVNYVKGRLTGYCQSWENALLLYKGMYNSQISQLQSKIDELTRQFEAADGNLNAALANYQQRTNSNVKVINKPIDLLQLNLITCRDEHCNVEDFRIPFAHNSIDSKNYDNITSQKITSLKIYRQQTLFLPDNLFEVFPLLTNLTITESGLCEISYSVFEGLDLFILNLTNNKISPIPVDTFADLENLQELDLSFNRIENLFDDVFVRLKGLKKLHLNNNYLTSINMEVLKHLQHFEALYLQNNRLMFIGVTMLMQFQSLKSIDLTGNVCIDLSHQTSTMVAMEKTIVDNCIAPVELNCKVVPIESKDDDQISCQAEGLVIVYPVTKVSELHGVRDEIDTITVFIADKQSIKYFPYKLSQNLPDLQRIEVHQSKLISLQQADFTGFSKLLEIVIKGNNLTSISQETFDSVPKLKLLDLSSNNIVSLPKNIFSRLTQLHTLILSNNRVVRFAANALPRKNMIDTFLLDNNELEFIETKTIRFLRKAKIIDLTENVCIDMMANKTQDSSKALMELSGEIDLNCSIDD